MENNSKKNKPQSREITKNSSLEEEIIKGLKERNESIRSGNVTEEDRSSKDDNKSGGFYEWSVSWP